MFHSEGWRRVLHTSVLLHNLAITASFLAFLPFKGIHVRFRLNGSFEAAYPSGTPNLASTSDGSRVCVDSRRCQQGGKSLNCQTETFYYLRGHSSATETPDCQLPERQSHDWRTDDGFQRLPTQGTRQAENPTGCTVPVQPNQSPPGRTVRPRVLRRVCDQSR